MDGAVLGSTSVRATAVITIAAAIMMTTTMIVLAAATITQMGMIVLTGDMAIAGRKSVSSIRSDAANNSNSLTATSCGICPG